MRGHLYRRVGLSRPVIIGTQARLSPEQIHEFIHSKVGITQDLTQQARLYRPVIRYRYRKMLWVTLISEPEVAPPLPDGLVADRFQYPDYLASRYDRQLEANTVTATLLIRVLDMSGMGWC